jgi:phage-related protein
VGDEIRAVQFAWPVGMPLVRKIEADLWEVRARVKDGIARVMFTVIDGKAILLHGFIKKAQKTPKTDLALAHRRKSLTLRR